MNIVCLDLEGVLVPEIWIAFAEASGIPELKRTTRDEPDYDKLMKFRLNILKEHGLGLKEIQATIAKIDPMPGAKEFLDALRRETQVIILSDTFTQFAAPLMEKLGMPTIFCNTLEVAENGEITGFRMRCEKSKLTTVKALQSIGYETIAKIDPLPGAKEFLDELRKECQVIILSDTFTQFAGPLMAKLGYPTIFCNTLEVAEDGTITGFRMRVEKSKYATVKALQSIGFDTIASGDSFNDLGMIEASKAGFLFRSTEEIQKAHPELPAFEEYDELLEAIKKAL
jgi:phosphoserine/homoserine phosphotransferase